MEGRLAGVSSEQLAGELVKAGFDRNLALAEMERMTRDPAYIVADRMNQRFNKLKAVLDVKHAAGSLAYGAGAIERRSKISEAEFLERYYSANKPVILTGLLADNPARKRWNPEYLGQVCGNMTVQIMSERHTDPDYEINCESHKHEVRMADYVATVLAGGVSNDYYMVANNGFVDRQAARTPLDEVPL